MIQRISLQEHIKRYVDVKKSGHNAIAKCPFHADSSPSLYIYPDNYHCFACKAHGNVIDFEMHQKNLSFRDAVFELGAMYQIEVSTENESTGNKRDKNDEFLSLKIDELHKELKKNFLAAPPSSVKVFLSQHLPEVGYLISTQLLESALNAIDKQIPKGVKDLSDLYTIPFQNERSKIFGYVFLQLEMEQTLNVPKVVNEFSVFFSDDSHHQCMLNFPQARKHIVDRALVITTNVFEFFLLLKHTVQNVVLIKSHAFSATLCQFFKKYVSHLYLLVDEDVDTSSMNDKDVPIFVRWVRKNLNDKLDLYRTFDTERIYDWIFSARRLNQSNDLSSGVVNNKNKSKKVQKKEIKIFEKTSSFYHRVLLHPSNQHVVQYLRTRGLDENDIKAWNLGFCPRDSILTRALLKDDADISIFLDLGILRLSQKNNQYYDFFYDRFVIPILNHAGECVALGGRILDDAQNVPKYINSAESILFSKSKILFNFHHAIDSIVEKEYVIVVEGFMDCMTLVKHGLSNVVAVMGTALTVEHLVSLSNLTKRVILCFDSDTAGKQAIKKSFLSNLKVPQLVLEVIQIPSEKDPDEYVKNHGIEAFLDIVKNKSVVIYEYVIKTIQLQSRDRQNFTLNLIDEFKTSELLLHSVLGKEFASFLLEKYDIKVQDIFQKKIQNNEIISSFSNENELPIWPVKNILELKMLFAFFYCHFSDLPKKVYDVLTNKEAKDSGVFCRAYENQCSPEGRQILHDLFFESKKRGYSACSQLQIADIEDCLELTKIFVAYVKKSSSFLINSGLGYLIDFQSIEQIKKIKFDLRNVFNPQNAQLLKIQLKTIEMSVASNKLLSVFLEILLQLELLEIDAQLEACSKTHFNAEIGAHISVLLQEREIRRVLLMS